MKRRTALILAMLMLAASVVTAPVGALAHGGKKHCSSLPFSGEGTEDRPYEIGSAKELILLSEAVNGGYDCLGVYFVLTEDISLRSAAFSPIGSGPSRPFAGSFDGRGFTVSGLVIKNGGEYSGLFGYSTGAIKGIALRDSKIEGGNYTAGIVGCGSAENCVNHAAVTGNAFVGGISGEGAVFDCENHGRIDGSRAIGGLTGCGDAYRSVNFAQVLGGTNVGGVCGVGISFDCEDRGSVFEAFPASERASKYSVSTFIKWALTHIDPATIPTNARLYLSASSCGTDPWEYLYGSVRAKTNQSTIDNYYSNNYNKYMTRAQYDEMVADWSRSTYACDCQGLLDAWMTYEAGVSTDINVQMNYDSWCTSKGEIASISRDWVVGEAVFVYSKKLGKMSHIGWICGFDEDGAPLVVEARGLYFGVVVTRLADRSWTHRGLMTVKFNYDASMSAKCGAYTPFDDELLPENTDIKSPETPERAIWDGSVASSFGGGSGTSDDPYKINTAAQLAYLSKKVSGGTTYSGKYFVLTSDLYLNDTSDWTEWDFLNRPANEWTPIGCYTTNSDYHPFRGSFDGGGHTIYGMFFSENKKSFFGLFGYVGANQNGCIKNVKIAKSFMEGVDNVAAIVGYLCDYGSIENCSNSGKVRGDHWIGGIVGFVTNSSGTTLIKSCTNSGTVRGATDTGGIVGLAHENCTVRSCSNTASYVKSYMNTGGVIGTAVSSAVENCRCNGDVRGAYYIGGVAGSIKSSTVNQCYSAHDLSTGFRTGGVVGTASGGSIKNCFNTGKVTCVEIAGGIIGTGSSVSIEDCYNIGKVTAKRKKGGVIGVKSGSTTVTDVYMLEGCCSSGTSYGTSLPLAAFASQSSYSGFDFDGVWKIDPDTAYPFAELRNIKYTSDNIPEYSSSDPTPTPAASPSADPTPTASPSGDPTPTPTAEPSSDPNDPSNYPVPTRTLMKGCTGDDVKWLQAALTKLGYPLEIDGNYGTNTYNAVVQFQADHGLDTDGICGPLTRAAIIEALAALEPDPTPTPTPTPDPTPEPSEDPTPEPTEEPTPEPTEEPTPEPTEEPTPEPTEEPTPEPTEEPTPEPTEEPTPEPTEEPTPEPTEEPTPEPTEEPTPEPTEEPTPEPTEDPTPEPTEEPTPEPTEEPTPEPTEEPTPEPTEEPTPEPYLAGDADGDGALTSLDALAILRYSIGLMELSTETLEHCDVTGDGKVDSSDALLILRMVLGMTDKAPEKALPVWERHKRGEEYPRERKD